MKTSARAAAVVAVSFLASSLGTVAAIAGPSVGMDASAVAKVVFHSRFTFNFDQGESLRPGTRVVDITGHHHYGVVRVSGAGHLRVRPGLKGHAAGYPGAGHGRAIIKIVHNGHLNPFRHPFSFGAAVRVTPRQVDANADPNIVQKGLYSHSSTQWKLQLVGARPSCVFNGTRHTVRLVSPLAVDDKKWHRLVCRRVGSTETLYVDGVVQGTATVRVGQIRNSEAVTVGGRAVGKLGSNDQFHGRVDNVFLKVGTLR